MRSNLDQTLAALIAVVLIRVTLHRADADATVAKAVVDVDAAAICKVADAAFRFNPMLVTQDDLTGFHGTNEKIGVQALAQGVRSYVQIVRNGASR